VFLIHPILTASTRSQGGRLIVYAKLKQGEPVPQALIDLPG
jgi:hypothetical protein